MSHRVWQNVGTEIIRIVRPRTGKAFRIGRPDDFNDLMVAGRSTG